MWATSQFLVTGFRFRSHRFNQPKTPPQPVQRSRADTLPLIGCFSSGHPRFSSLDFQVTRNLKALIGCFSSRHPKISSLDFQVSRNLKGVDSTFEMADSNVPSTSTRTSTNASTSMEVQVPSTMEERLAVVEATLFRIEESVSKPLLSLRPKLEALLEKDERSRSTASSSHSSASASSATLFKLIELGSGEALLRLLVDEEIDVRRNVPRTESGDTALHVAASGGHVGATLVLLGAGADANAAGHRLRRPLHCAAAHGHLRVAQRLLDAGARVDDRDGDGASALALAAAGGHAQVVRLLLNRGAKLTESIALTVAIEGNANVLEVLLEKGASVDACDENGHPLLVLATRRKRWEVVRLLLEKGASPTKCKEFKESALFYASIYGEAEIVRQLLCCKAASNEEQLKFALSCAKSAAVVWTFVDLVPSVVESIAGALGIMGAARDGRLEVLKALLQAGVDVNGTDGSNRTALLLAAWNGHLPCMEELLRRGANPNAIAEKLQNAPAGTPLHWASSRGHVECVRALLAAGANPQMRNTEGKTPLDLAQSDEVRNLLGTTSISPAPSSSALLGAVRRDTARPARRPYDRPGPSRHGPPQAAVETASPSERS